MKAPKLLIAIALLSAPTLRADDATVPPAPPTPPTPALPGATVVPGSGSVIVQDAQGNSSTDGSDTKVWTFGGARGGGGGFGATGGFGGNGAGAFFDGSTVRLAGWTNTDRPALITTQAMDAKTQSEWKEDLNVMNKVVRDEIARVAGDFAPQAMGIALRFSTNSAPMYVEGCGVIFTSSVTLPLSAGNATGKADDKTGDSNSAWEKAKIELDIANGHKVRVITGRNADAIAKFDQSKLDSLIDSIVKILPEANHIRSLKPDESVIVTIGGTDDAGAPLRLTLKAKKSDIDDAASGKLKPEEFKQRVAQRIGG